METQYHKLLQIPKEAERWLSCLSSQQLKMVDRILQSRLYWMPQSSKQWLAYLSPADELYYGGAAGGGKTDLLLGLAANEHTRSIIFRRQYTQLRAIKLRSKILFSNHAKWNGQEMTWTFNRTQKTKILELGAVQYEDDVRNFQGRPHDFIGFDEITQFTQYQYDFLRAWRRTEDPLQRTRVVVTGNPPMSPGESWVRRYWAPWLDSKYTGKRAAWGELRWFARVDDEDIEVESSKPFTHKGELIHPISRTFIYANIKDNPYYSKTDYETVLQNLPEPLRSALLYGKMDTYIEDDPWQVIPTAWVEAAIERGRGVCNTEPDMIDCVGVDVARGGRDKTTIARRYGNIFYRLKKFPGQSTPNGQTVAAQVMSALNREKTTRINIDVIGIGASVYDILTTNGVYVFPVNSAEKSIGRDRSGKFGFVNLRAEMWWRFREMLDPNYGENIALPDDSELLADLTAPRYELTIRGIKIESKEDVKQRLGRSPDCGDAVVYASYVGLLPDITVI